uniref:Uncharacterized protein n=1 Tax=Amphimedon queenslandica TaxID=400682 RepID=A0A1X7ULS5_AMPQE
MVPEEKEDKGGTKKEMDKERQKGESLDELSITFRRLGNQQKELKILISMSKLLQGYQSQKNDFYTILLHCSVRSAVTHQIQTDNQADALQMDLWKQLVAFLIHMHNTSTVVMVLAGPIHDLVSREHS